MTTHRSADRRASRVSALRLLFDARVEGTALPRLVPWIHTLGIVLAGALCLAVAALGFWWSWVAGLVWLVLLAPLVFLALVAALRLALAFVLAVFRMGEQIHRLDRRMADIVAELRAADASLSRVDYNVEALNRRITQIHEEIPRLMFWRRGSNDRRDKRD